MFFLWGVFKGNKENCLRVLGAEKLLTQDIPMTIPDNLCDLGPLKSAACGSTTVHTEMPASKESESGECGPQCSPQVSKDVCI